jgi:hypothetical protein
VKPYYKSKTFWANVLIGLLAGVGALSQQATGVDSSTWLEISAVLNIALRFVTSQPVTASRDQGQG